MIGVNMALFVHNQSIIDTHYYQHGLLLFQNWYIIIPELIGIWVDGASRIVHGKTDQFPPRIPSWKKDT